jgi:flagellar biosynthesis/type III secretory pathway protein FliH
MRPFWTTRPRDQLPRIVDPFYATKLPELAVLSTLAHPELEVAETAIDAISTLPEDQRQLYLDIILMSLPRKVRRLLEGRMKGYVYQSEFARKYYYQGHDKGVEEGMEKGVEKGLRAAVAAIAVAKHADLSPAQQAAIDTLGEAGLTTLLRALGRARSAAAARAVLDAAVQGDPGT